MTAKRLSRVCRVSDPRQRMRSSRQSQDCVERRLVWGQGSWWMPGCPRHGSVAGFGPAGEVAASGTPAGSADAKPAADEAEVTAKTCEVGDKAVRFGRRGSGSRWRLAHHLPAGQCTADMSGQLRGPCGPRCWALLCTSMLPTVSCTGLDMALELENKPAPQSRNHPIASAVGIAKPVYAG